jgi:nucleoside-diphosphate-sugar epimerase
MKFVVTGSSGFVGRNLVRALIDQNKEVVALTTAKYIPVDYLKGATVIRVRSLCETNPDILRGSVICHCAWENVHNILDTSHLMHTSEQLNFLNLVAKSSAKKLVMTGTCYEFGTTTGAVSISDVSAPNTPYSQAKDFIHKAGLSIIANDTNIEFVWARLFYIYGVGQNHKAFYTQLMKAIQSEKKTFNMSLGEQLFDWLPIETVSLNLSKILTTVSPKIVHVCSGEPVSLRRLAEMLIAKKQSSLEINLGFYPYREQDALAIWGAESFTSQFD